MPKESIVTPSPQDRALEMIREYVFTYTHEWSGKSMMRMTAFIGWLADTALLHPDKVPASLSNALAEYAEFVKKAAEGAELP